MERLGRILAIVLLALFAAGTVAHAASATRMSFAMSPAAMAAGNVDSGHMSTGDMAAGHMGAGHMGAGDMGAGDMGDCDGCPPGDDGKASLCVQVCLAPFIAVPAAAGFELPLMAADVTASPAEELTGLIGPPESPPPRTIIL
ncbi:hypothetical protein [Sinorhizobium psoraleae]|uniref:DUF2946 domain-containing protein n=1 Tax=Sinorhizobium psoraleae TaxID=520838 RepID=A0ABT4KKG6_9HYPH|nr:hypothetical protein [Sinorhizobium psoraleae]MCZ4092449.1 hypothetical protein [Sinorhizobium psoraleae]